VEIFVLSCDYNWSETDQQKDGLSQKMTIFIWGVRWSAWVWPGQKTMAPTGFEPPQLIVRKKSLKFQKNLFL
jgi:hypothetical protein